jgi:hypothetical protein
MYGDSYGVQFMQLHGHCIRRILSSAMWVPVPKHFLIATNEIINKN